MKTILLIPLCGLVACLSAAAQTNIEADSFKASIYPVLNTSIVRVLVSKEYGKKFSLSLTDAHHNPVYFEQLMKKSTQHRFDLNLKEMADGRYYITLSDGKNPVVTKTVIKERVVLAKPILSDQIVCLN